MDSKEIKCNCNRCPGELYCGSAFGTLIVMKDEKDKPAWYRQISINPDLPNWEKITK